MQDKHIVSMLKAMCIADNEENIGKAHLTWHFLNSHWKFNELCDFHFVVKYVSFITWSAVPENVITFCEIYWGDNIFVLWKYKICVRRGESET